MSINAIQVVCTRASTKRRLVWLFAVVAATAVLSGCGGCRERVVVEQVPVRVGDAEVAWRGGQAEGQAQTCEKWRSELQQKLHAARRRVQTVQSHGTVWFSIALCSTVIAFGELVFFMLLLERR